MKDKKSPPECPSSGGSWSPALGNSFLGGEASGLFKWCSCNPEGPLVKKCIKNFKMAMAFSQAQGLSLFFFQGGPF